MINANKCLANSSQRLGSHMAPGLPRFDLDFGVVSSLFAPVGAILRARGALIRAALQWHESLRCQRQVGQTKQAVQLRLFLVNPLPRAFL